MIDVRGVTKYYGAVPAVHDVTFRVGQGEVVGFLGPNGAGKTTTMRILTGYSPPSRGSATVAGCDICEAPLAVKRRVGYMPERVPLYDEMLVSSFLRYAAEVKGVARRERRSEVARVVERCGLGPIQTRLVGHLSKGFRQRVGLAQALIGNPPVLILDEPTVGLDPQQIVDIRRMISGLAPAHTVLLSTHILPEVEMTCQRALIIHEGRIVAEESMAALAASGRRTEIEVRGPRDGVLAALGAVQGVRNVSEQGPGRYLVEVDGGAPARERIAAALVSAGHGLLAMKEHRRTLEEAFIEAVASEEGSAR